MARSHKQKKVFYNSEKRLEKIHYRIVIGLMIAFVVFFFFTRDKIIGEDYRFQLFVFWLPLITGIFALAIYRRNFLKVRIMGFKQLGLRLLAALFYMVQGVLFSFLSAGLLALVIWYFINQQVAKENSLQTISCPVTRIWAGRHSSISFNFMGREQNFTVRYRDIKNYEMDKPENYEVQIYARPGVWNHYFVEDWEMRTVK